MSAKICPQCGKDWDECPHFRVTAFPFPKPVTTMDQQPLKFNTASPLNRLEEMIEKESTYEHWTKTTGDYALKKVLKWISELKGKVND